MTIPSNVTSIGAQAFGDCTNFESITIPVETVQIAEDAFEGCARLTIHATEGSVAWNYARSFYEKQKSMPGYDSSQTPAATPVPTVTPQPTVTPSPAQSTGKLVGSSNVVGNRGSHSDECFRAGNTGRQSGIRSLRGQRQFRKQSGYFPEKCCNLYCKIYHCRRKNSGRSGLL